MTNNYFNCSCLIFGFLCLVSEGEEEEGIDGEEKENLDATITAENDDSQEAEMEVVQPSEMEVMNILCLLIVILR